MHMRTSATGKTRPRTGRDPAYIQDTDGASIAIVPTDRPGKPVKVLAEDWLAYLAAGYSPFIYLMGNGKDLDYARVARPGVHGRPAIVVRVLLGVPEGCQVRYLDGDRRNLRRDNIAFSASGRARERQ
jgi:hypothetical protein